MSQHGCSSHPVIKMAHFRIRKAARVKGNKLCTMANIAEEHSVDLNLLKGRYKAGTRVVYLAAGGK